MRSLSTKSALCYSRLSVYRPSLGIDSSAHMDFGLLPEFSTPVEKPVENAGILRPWYAKDRLISGLFEAKAREITI